MRFIFIVLFVAFGFNFSIGQIEPTKLNESNKGRFYIYWGYNWGHYSKSDIRFKGNDYNFTLNDAFAKDRQSPFAFDTYLNPKRITIPQYNFRLGYFFKDKWDLSFGVDHMKYVLQQGQSVQINGSINVTNSPYNKVYKNENVIIEEGFLEFEHSDGLNYLNFEIKHSDLIFDFGKIKVNLKEGLGLGFVMPKTNATLLDNDRYDDFNIAGFGVGPMLGLNVAFGKLFFIQTEVKAGFIDLPNIRTTKSQIDSASQHFFFSQYNILIGFNFL